MRNFFTFILVGGLGLLVNLLVSFVLTHYLKFWYLLSYTIATLVAWTVVFFVNSLVTFAGHSKERYLHQYISFIAGYAGIFCISVLFVYVFTSLLHWHYLFSITITAAITAVLTFFFSKRYVYHA